MLFHHIGKMDQALSNMAAMDVGKTDRLVVCMMLKISEGIDNILGRSDDGVNGGVAAKTMTWRRQWCVKTGHQNAATGVKKGG